MKICDLDNGTLSSLQLALLPENQQLGLTLKE